MIASAGVARIANIIVKKSLSRNYAAGASFLCGVPLTKRDGQSAKVEDLKNKAIILYFSAGWCGHCRLFSPKLKKWYEEAAKNENIEIIWVSRDKKQEDLVQYYNKALPDVPYIPFGDKHIPEFIKKYGVATIPMAILVNDKGEIVDKDARSKIQDQSDGANLAKQFRDSV